VTREVVLYGRIHCGLCEDAAEELRRLEPELRFTCVERDIDADPLLRARYNERVPVVTLAGREIASAPIDPAGLREALLNGLTG
jgi:hypothetical protein